MISAQSSLKFLVVVEVPLYFNMSALMGLTRYDSEDDDEDTSLRKFHFLDWRPEVRRLPLLPLRVYALSICARLSCLVLYLSEMGPLSGLESGGASRRAMACCLQPRVGRGVLEALSHHLPHFVDWRPESIGRSRVRGAAFPFSPCTFCYLQLEVPRAG